MAPAVFILALLAVSVSANNCSQTTCSGGYAVWGLECDSCGGNCTDSYSAADWPDFAAMQADSSTAGQETCEGEGTIFYVCDDDDTLSLHVCGGGEYYTGPAFCDEACYGVEEVMGCTYDRQVCDGDYLVMESYCGAGMEEDYCDDCLISRSEENWPMFADLGADCPNEYGFSFVCVDGTLQQRLCVYSYGTDEIDDKTSQEYVTIISTDMICYWEDCVSYSYSYSYESDDDEQYTKVAVVWELTVEGTTVAEAEANMAVYIDVVHEISEVDAADITVSFALATRRRSLLADDSVVATFNFETSAMKGIRFKLGVEGASTSQLEDVLQASAAEAGEGVAFAAVTASSTGSVMVDNFSPSSMPTSTSMPTAAAALDGALASRPSKRAAALAAVGGAFLGLLAL